MIYMRLFFEFFKIGLFTFGGGYAMLPLIQQVVLENNWLGENELIDFIAISESTPGPFAVNASTFVGMQTAGIPGAIFATFGVVLPSFVIILIIAMMYEKFQNNRVVNSAMIGLKGTVVGLIASAIMSTGISVFGEAIQTVNVKELLATVVLIVGLALGLNKKISPIVLIFVSAIIGILVNPILN